MGSLSSFGPRGIRSTILTRAVCILLLVAFLFPGHVSAQQTRIALYAAPGGLSSGNCTSWAEACELQYALSIAGPSIFYVYRISAQEGTYYPTGGSDRTISFVLKNGVSILGGYSAIDHTRNPALYVTILSGDLAHNDGANFANNADNSYHVVDANGADGTARLDGLTIAAGNANGGFGGGVGGGLFNLSGSPGLIDVVFSRNYASQNGGGMYSAGSPALTRVRFFANDAVGGGGGLYCLGTGASLSDVVFYANHSWSDGAGLWNLNGCSTMTKVTFAYNLANSNGAGAYNYTSSSLNLSNVTFYLNYAAGDGGGMYNNEVGSQSLTNVTFTENNADHGGAIYNVNTLSSSPALTNVILWEDHAGVAGPEIYNAGTTPSIGYSVVQGGCASIPDATCGGGNLSTDPRLGVLADNLGYSETVALGIGSSALDSGQTVVSPTTDQRGVPRPQDGDGDGNAAYDIGALEAVSVLISGNAGVSGALISYAGGSTTSDGTGGYAFSVVDGWDGSVTPSKTNFLFTPDHRDYVNVYTAQTDQDYVADAQAPTVLQVYPADNTTACLKPKVGADLLLAALVRTPQGVFDPSTVTLKLDGIDVTGSATITESGASLSTQATILYTPPTSLSKTGHSAALIYPAVGGGTTTYAWNFTAAAITCANMAPLTEAQGTTAPDAAPDALGPLTIGELPTLPGRPIQSAFRRPMLQR